LLNLSKAQTDAKEPFHRGADHQMIKEQEDAKPAAEVCGKRGQS
jgi:hypothetical protein